MNKINIFGKGGHASVIESIIDNSLCSEVNTIMDDKDYKKTDDGKWLIGIGNNEIRKKKAEGILKGEKFHTLISNSSIVYDSHMISSGTVIFHGAIIQVNVKIGNHCIINTNSNIDHDCIIGDYVHIAPGSTLCGGVTVGENTLIGAGSTVIPGINIGKNCIIGAGSVVVKDIPDNTKAFGNPCSYKNII